MLKKEKVYVFGVYRKNKDSDYEVESMELRNISNKQAKDIMYDRLFIDLGISHRNIIKVFTRPKNPH